MTTEKSINRRDVAYEAYKACPDFLAARLAVIFTVLSSDKSDGKIALHNDMIVEIQRLVGPHSLAFLQAVADRVLYYAEQENANERISNGLRLGLLSLFCDSFIGVLLYSVVKDPVGDGLQESKTMRTY